MSGNNNNKKTLLLVVNDAAFFLSHRLPIALEAARTGYEVHVATPPCESVAKIQAAGLQHHPVVFNRSGLNPFQDIYSLFSLFRLFRRIRPHIVHLVTIKPVLYGGIAARLASVPAVVAAVSGLGYVFTADDRRNSLLRVLVAGLYRAAFRHSRLQVIFQNSSDRELLMQIGAVKNPQTVLIRGSGVDLEHYSSQPEPAGIPIIVMASRLLVNKGVPEFVQASHFLSEWGTEAVFRLIGEPDPNNPDSIAEKSLRTWEKQGLIEWLGQRDDIAQQFAEAHIVTLPSYYGEGLPKVLMEAAACGRPVVTTDSPGCRDAIIPNETGLLIPARNAEALARALQKLIDDPAVRKNMGQAGRHLAEREFGVEKVVNRHMSIYNELLAR